MTGCPKCCERGKTKFSPKIGALAKKSWEKSRNFR